MSAVPKNINNKDYEIIATKLTSVQQSIYNGLLNIGQEIAFLYFDGIKILNDNNLKTKAYLLGHLAREIDGGFRDLFIENKNRQKCKECGHEIKSDDYKDSIASTLGTQREDKFVKEWHDVAKKFHAYGHRHGAWKEIRKPDEMVNLWHEYEKILTRLIGSHFAFASRLDRFITIDNPTKDQINFLINSINNPALKAYFFGKVKSKSWFFPLKERGFFSSNNAPGSIQSIDNLKFFTIPYWAVLDYLEHISEQIAVIKETEYLDSLIEIITDVTKNGPKENFRTWWYFVKIISNLPKEYITVEILNFIPVWLGSEFDSSLPGKEISDRLLPKFISSNDNIDIQKAELIIKQITGLKIIPDVQKQKEGHLGEEKLVTLLDGYWLLEAFKKHSGGIAKYFSNTIIFDIASKIEKLLKITSSERILKHNDISILLSLKENENIYVFTIYEFKNETLSEDLSNYKNELYKNKPINGIKPKIFSFKNKSTVTDFINPAFKKIITLYPDLKLREKEIHRILFNLYLYLYNIGTYESFYSKHPVHTNDTLSVFHQILTLVLIERAKIKHSENIDILDSFLKNKYLYFKKFAFYLIGLHLKQTNKLLWDYIKADKLNLIFESVYFGDEVRHVLEHIGPLDKASEALLDKKITSFKKNLIESKLQDKLVLSLIQRYYKALSHNEFFNKKYLKLRKMTGADPELGPAIYIGEAKWGPGPSPLSEEELLEKNNEELADFLIQFKTKDLWDGPTEEALSEKFRNIAKQNPKKLIENLNPFINISYRYIYDMLWGFVDAWNQSIPLDWNVLFDFIQSYIDRTEFWDKKLDIKGAFANADIDWVVSAVGELIQVGTRKDENAFPIELNNQVFRIIELILKNLNNDEETDVLDPVTHALNSSHGKILTALIYLSLRQVRIYGKSQAQPFIDNTLKLYESEIDKKTDEAFTLFGEYISQFNYFNEEWANRLINRIYEIRTSGNYWKLFMSGYLFPANVDNSVYKKMYDHYVYALHIDHKGGRFSETLGIHIAIGYLRGIDDNSKKSLYDILFESWNIKYIEELIQFFWMQRDYLTQDKSITGEEQILENQKYVSKIINFWRQVFEHYYNKEVELKSFSLEDKKIISSIAKLAVFLNNITKESFVWMKFSAPYIKLDFNYSFFIEYLDLLKGKGTNIIETANMTADIYLEILKHFFPDFDMIHIHSIVKYLFELSKMNTLPELKQKANDICNIYGPSGIKGNDGREFLRDLFEEYNKL